MTFEDEAHDDKIIAALDDVQRALASHGVMGRTVALTALRRHFPRATPAPAGWQGNPDAWQRRKKYALAGDPPGRQYQWEPCSRQEATGHFDRQPGYEYRALYTIPTAPAEGGV
ncbi:hypothetical protein LH128_00105 [Sphingomonas sp. LH128]|uniref:hypothetical protein n=1 Tax=Sphingomonas sp. LH128 TaxID=473781 RepID=UPI00027CB140|nr:hypothetical protein [Sphingomonas sp. LH128]EJU15138.1 hypothetical protein LH128_00105 [Sphingomonas sp. LH128]